jgi:hypothetical protein
VTRVAACEPRLYARSRDCITRVSPSVCAYCAAVASPGIVVEFGCGGGRAVYNRKYRAEMVGVNVVVFVAAVATKGERLYRK